MLIYFLLPLLVMYCLFMSRLTVVKNYVQGHNYEFYVNKNHLILFFWSIILLGIAVFKGVEVGTDYPMYYGFFLYSFYEEFEPGIRFIYYTAVRYDHFLIFSFSIYFLIIFFVFKGIKENSPNYLISILLFIITFMYFNSYNQLRQMIAASIIFCFANYIVANNKIKFVFVILLALLFHDSAIFLFLLFLIPKKRISGKLVIPLFLLTIILYFTPEFKNIVGRLIIYFSGSYAEKYTSNLDFFFEVNKEKGLLQLMPVLIQMVIVSLSSYFPMKDMNLSVNYKLYDFSINLVVINLCLYSLAGIEAVDRLQLYFAFFNIYYYSILIHFLLNCKNVFYGQVFVLIIIGFWCSYYVMRLIINIGGIVPYSTFFS